MSVSVAAPQEHRTLGKIDASASTETERRCSPSQTSKSVWWTTTLQSQLDGHDTEVAIQFKNQQKLLKSFTVLQSSVFLKCWKIYLLGEIKKLKKSLILRLF